MRPQTELRKNLSRSPSRNVLACAGWARTPGFSGPARLSNTMKKTIVSMMAAVVALLGTAVAGEVTFVAGMTGVT